jgi:hypothetical protein
MLLDVQQNGKIVLGHRDRAAKLHSGVSEVPDVVVPFAPKGLTGFRDFGAMMKILDGLLEVAGNGLMGFSGPAVRGAGFEEDEQNY